MGKTEIAMKALFQETSSEYSNRTGGFLDIIGFAEAARIHPEIAELYALVLRAEAAEESLADAQ